MVIAFGGADIDHAQRAGLPDGIEAGLVAQGGVGQHFADLEPGEARLQGGEAVREEGAFVGVGRIEAGAHGPGAGEAVVEQAVGVGGVAVDVAAVGGRMVGQIGLLVAAFIVDEAGLSVGRRRPAADLGAGGRVTGTALPAGGAGRAGAAGRRGRCGGLASRGGAAGLAGASGS